MCFVIFGKLFKARDATYAYHMYSQLIDCEGEQAGGRMDSARLEGVSVHTLYVRVS